MVHRHSHQIREPASGGAMPVADEAGSGRGFDRSSGQGRAGGFERLRSRADITFRAVVLGAVAFSVLLGPASRIAGAVHSAAGDPIRAEASAPADHGAAWQERGPIWDDAGLANPAASPPAIRVYGIDDAGLRAIAKGVLNTVAADVDRRLGVLSPGLALEATSCGAAPEHLAYWDRARTTVVVCSELIEELQKAEAIHEELNAERHRYGGENQALIERYVGYDAAESVLFIAYHELGHAVIDMYNLEVPGNEEHAADAFATWWTIEGGAPRTAVQGAMTFDQFGMIEAQDPHVRHSELHGPSAERYQNIACWLVGAGREVPAYFMEDVQRLRPSPCTEEYRRLDEQWTGLLAPHLRW